MTKLTKEEATQFFSELYNGSHHLPSEVKDYGNGFYIHDRGNRFATFDFSYLTKLVIMAHDYAYRAEIRPYGVGYLQIIIWKRQREGSMYERHPTMEQAIQMLRKPQPVNGNQCRQDAGPEVVKSCANCIYLDDDLDCGLADAGVAAYWRMMNPPTLESVAKPIDCAMFEQKTNQ